MHFQGEHHPAGEGGYDVGPDKVRGRPFLKPLYGPPPWQYIDDVVVLVTYKAEAAAIREVLPRPVVPDPDGIVVAGFFVCPEVTGIGPHAFTILSIPVHYQGKPYQFCPYLYTSTDSSLAAYREGHGWPGVMGQTEITAADGRFRARLTRGGREIMAADGEVSGDPISMQSSDFRPWLMYKEIMSPDGTRCDVSQFVASTSLFTKINLRVGRGRLRFPDPGDDPSARLRPIDVIEVAYGTMDDLYPETIWAV